MTQYQVTANPDVVHAALQREEGLAQLVTQVLNQILAAQVSELLPERRYGCTECRLGHRMGSGHEC